MPITRRLSLTLLLVAPLIAAQDSQESEAPSSISGEHLPDGQRRRPSPDLVYDDQEETSTYGSTMSTVPVTEVFTFPVARGQESRLGGDSVREKREDKPFGDLETAEQVIFRPYFRHQQALSQRADRKSTKQVASTRQAATVQRQAATVQRQAATVQQQAATGQRQAATGQRQAATGQQQGQPQTPGQATYPFRYQYQNYPQSTYNRPQRSVYPYQYTQQYYPYQYNRYPYRYNYYYRRYL